MYLTNPTTDSTVKADEDGAVLRFPVHRTGFTGGLVVQRLDGYFLYQVGAALRPLTTIAFSATTNSQLRSLLWGAEQWLRNLLQQDLIGLRTCRPKGVELYRTIEGAKAELEAMSQERMGEEVDWITAHSIQSQATDFQTLLSAELSISDVYVVRKKGAYDITSLAEDGLSVFPQSLALKIPEAVKDAEQAARCLAFELPTAAAFHMHLVLERVLRRYYAVVTNDKPPPDSRNIGAFIDAMKKEKQGDKKIFSALADIARFHRNPVLHPDEKLDSTEDAIGLLGSIFSALVQMLKIIPEPELKLVMQDAETKAA